MPDNALCEMVLRAIAAKGYSELRTLEVVATGDRVVLRGKVTSFYLKQVALAAACGVAGSESLLNEIEVVPANQRSE